MSNSLNYVRPLGHEYKPKELELEILEYWRNKRVYDKIRESLKNGSKFYFLDGPPYPSSDTPHIGTLWNKIMKDVIVRYRRSRGYNVIDKPGYDCHGLPIEVKIEQELGFKSKKDIEGYGVERFIERCKEFALRNVESMTRWFEEFGVSLRWDSPYMTLTPEYIQSAWWLVKRADQLGLLERGLKVVHWCPRCETALADYEVTEYRDLTDPSIYVKFPVKGEKDSFLLIWTTTPWTLPANVAVMVHPDLKYAWVEVEGEKFFIASSRLEAVMNEAGISQYKVLKEVKGSELEGLEYVHPLTDEIPIHKEIRHRIVLSDEFVSSDEGTGLVHCAPGHGEEDFEVGKAHGLRVLAPVDDRGVFTQEAGKYAGKPAREANWEIVEDLKARGSLFHAGKITHRYPVCWRCKTPLLLRATSQWYIRVSHMKEKFLREAERVNWIPQWAGSARFRGWIENLRDWLISRQRYWGTPAPIWICEKCGERVIVGSLKELESLAGTKLELKTLHRPWIDRVIIKCNSCGGLMSRVEDVLDVWLDSGVAFYASLGYPLDSLTYELVRPVDVVVEGHDQIAGWFFSMMRCGLIAFGAAPYTNVVMHGFVLDEKGREMHKSLGNYVAPSQVLDFEKGGRDVLRWYVLRNTVWEDLRFSWRGLAEVFDDLNIFWNVYVFVTTYMSIDRFNPAEHPLEKYISELRSEDRWLLSKTERLTVEVSRWLDNYEIHRAARALRDFIVDDVSRWYIRLIRPRVWIEENVHEKLSAYAVLYYVLRKFLLLAAPFLPFATEYIYLRSFRVEDDPETVHMLPWPKPREEFVNEELERQMDIVRRLIERSAAARMRVGVKLRVPLPRLYVMTDDPTISKAVEELKNLLISQANVREVYILPSPQISKFIKLEAKPVYEALGPVFRSTTPKVVEALSHLDALQLRSELKEKGEAYVTAHDGERYRITSSMVRFEESTIEGYVIEYFDGGCVVLEAKVGEEELAEGLTRDVVRRVQFMRKLAKLPVDSFIQVSIYASPELKRVIESRLSYVAGETRARSITLVDREDEVAGDFVQEWDLDGYYVKIAISSST
ncbi:MAG: isoleucine--tRNA ligase [Thermofilaceae archaeon]|nr:isoleucine--tRNA ligase [Thermofilaceae archaeon]